MISGALCFLTFPYEMWPVEETEGMLFHCSFEDFRKLKALSLLNMESRENLPRYRIIWHHEGQKCSPKNTIVLSNNNLRIYFRYILAQIPTKKFILEVKC